MSPDQARKRGLTPTGNIAPEGSLIKSTAIDPGVVDRDGVYRHTGPARVFTSERAAIGAIKAGRIVAGDVMVYLWPSKAKLSTSPWENVPQLRSALRASDRLDRLTATPATVDSDGPWLGHEA
ncbi:MAG: hypothetical protein ACYDAG_04745 [Chloroflexota bacterium]